MANSSKQKLCLVVQRYGEEICGGAELLCFQFVQHLKKYYDIDIITTTAIDDTTWDNYYPEGTTVDENTKIIRFSVDTQRLWNRENNLTNLIKDKKHSYEEEIATLQDIGPFSSKLFNFIRINHSKYQAVIFFTYYYYQTSIAAFGIDNAILLPCAHDEINIYLNHYKRLFSQTKAYIFNTQEEKTLVEKIIDKPINVPNEVIGCGIELYDNNKLKEFDKIKKCTNDPYILYVGRIVESKGCDELFDYFLEYKKHNKKPLKLVLIGKAQMSIPNNKDIVNLGFVSSEVKNAYMKNAKALILPSHNESLSLVLLEALSLRCPVIVTDKCLVTKKHIEKSKAGIIYNNYKTFETAINYLCQNDKYVSTLKNNGITYIKENYSWQIIEYKLNKIISAFPKIEDEAIDYSQFIQTNIHPIFKEKYIPIIFASDDNYVPYLSVALQSLVDNMSSKNNYDIVILSDNINQNNKNTLKRCYSKDNVSIRFYECSTLLDKVAFSIHNKQLSRSTFTRLFCLDIFSDYDKIVYLDCDIIIKCDIANILNLDLKNNYLAAVQDQHIETIRTYRDNIKKYLIKDVNRKNDYFNAGVLIFNITELRKHFSITDLIDIAVSKCWLWEDQDILNHISENKTYWLNRSWNVIWIDNKAIENCMQWNTDYLNSLNNPKIIHFAGGTIPTKNNNSPYRYDFYMYARKSPYFETLFTCSKTSNKINHPFSLNKMKCKLFGFIPLYGYKHVGGRKVWKVLGLPVFKIRKMSNGITTKYYIFNIPVMKISRK